MNANSKKLTLHRETVRTLQDTELHQLAGGRAALMGAPQYRRVAATGGGCSACVCHSTSTGNLVVGEGRMLIGS